MWFLLFYYLYFIIRMMSRGKITKILDLYMKSDRINHIP